MNIVKIQRSSHNITIPTSSEVAIGKIEKLRFFRNSLSDFWEDKEYNAYK